MIILKQYTTPAAGRQVFVVRHYCFDEAQFFGYLYLKKVDF